MPEALKEEDAESQISPFGSGLVDDSFTYGVRTTGVAFYKEGLFSSLPVGWGFQLYINFDFTVRKTSTDTIHSSSINNLVGLAMSMNQVAN